MTPSKTSNVAIANIRARVAHARGLLVEQRPDLTSILLDLQYAVEEMRRLGPETPAAELHALRSDLAGIATLARNGEDFWRAWGRLSGLEPGYTPEGLRAAERSTSRIAVQG